MAYSPLYSAVNMFGESECTRKKLKAKPVADRTDRKLFAHLTFIEDPTLEEFTTLSSLNGGAAYISNVLGLSLGTVQQMKYSGYTTRYWKRYLEARQIAKRRDNLP